MSAAIDPKAPMGLPMGLHHGIPDAVYHAPRLGVISKSALDRVAQSPAHYRHWLRAGVEETEPMRFGARFHCAVLEPEIFAARYVEMPAFGDQRYKSNKAARLDWEQEHLHAGVAPIPASDMAAIRQMQAAVLAHPLVGRMLVGGHPEVTITWRDPDTSLYAHARADYYHPERRLAIDLKTTTDASLDAFRKAITTYRYYVQDALYRAAFAQAGAPVDHFVMVAVEKREPFGVGVYSLDADGVRTGHIAARRDIETLARCVESDEWPGYPTTIQTIDLPPWAA